MEDNNNFDRFLDNDRIEKCNLDFDLDIFQFENNNKKTIDKIIPKDIHELSIIKGQPISPPYGTKLDDLIKY